MGGPVVRTARSACAWQFGDGASAMKHTRLILGMVTACCSSALLSAAAAPLPQAELVEVKRIWDAAPHNAFTDLIRFKGRWFCVFREGQAHVSPDGALRVITSKEGKAWTSAARLTYPKADLRDAKITVTP